MDYHWIKDRIVYGVLGELSGAAYGFLIYVSSKQKLF